MFIENAEEIDITSLRGKGLQKDEQELPKDDSKNKESKIKNFTILIYSYY